jgi:uncharacterized protein YndB with AHSA1/START domain
MHLLVQADACQTEELSMTTTSERTGDFTAVLNLPLSPEKVLALFTSAEGVGRWWGETQGDAAVGGVLTTSFGHHGDNAMRVVEAGPSRVVWETVRTDTPTQHEGEWMGTTMVFDLAPASGGTVLHFRHLGMTPQLACWDDCYAGWTHFMSSIQTYAETGTGTPHGA